MVDERYFREGVVGSLLGEGQMKWLEAQLLDCRSPFIILSSGTMWNDSISNGKDSWGRWDPEGRERLFAFIEANRIAGVLLVSGDRHGARGFRIPRLSGFNFYEFEPGSLGGRSGPPIFAKDRANQLFGNAGRYAFGEFTMDATLADPAVEFRLIGDDGTMIHEMRLTRSQLTPPAKPGTDWRPRRPIRLIKPEFGAPKDEREAEATESTESLKIQCFRRDPRGKLCCKSP